MKDPRSGNKEGFSLIEILVVLVVICLLVLVIAHSMLQYVESSKQLTDRQAVESVHTAIVAAMLSPAVTDAPFTAEYESLAELYEDIEHPEFVKAVMENVGEDEAAYAEGGIFQSDAYQGGCIKIQIEDSQVTCRVISLKAGVPDIVVE